MNNQYKHFLVVVLCLFVAGLTGSVGCNLNRDGTIAVFGDVSFQGKKLEEGIIVFLGSDASIAQEAGNIKNGSYSVRMPEGARRVQITSQVADGTIEVPMPPNGMQQLQQMKQIIPEKYNTDTQLQVTISKSSRVHHFDLTAE